MQKGALYITDSLAASDTPKLEHFIDEFMMRSDKETWFVLKLVLRYRKMAILSFRCEAGTYYQHSFCRYLWLALFTELGHPTSSALIDNQSFFVRQDGVATYF